MCEDIVDYYEILECDRAASYDELKKNYQRLALLLHPDRNENKQNDEKFLLLQKAWSVLRDPESRKQFDALLVCHDHSNLLLFETLSLSEMSFDETECGYSYPCRCSGLYFLEMSDANPPSVVVGCNECSFSIQVNIPQL
ncbi:unnamed protein product [Pieris brassicae]|uniref:J domain-containing protein n=1 Tax=Pieris brassicae TaxID=7116 RepID=A0A9P0XJI9_PIEBR|nr:unnamed protein product [Pieris brassicae]